MEEFFRVGVFANTHGLKGEIKVYPTTDDISRFDYLKTVYMDTKAGRLRLEAQSVKYFKGMVILKFKGIDRIEDIEKYKGSDLLVAREDAIPLEEGEYYIADIINMPVYDEEERLIGRVKEVMQTGANDVYVIEKEEGGELLLPSIPLCVLKRDFENFRMTVHVLEGLEDL